MNGLPIQPFSLEFHCSSRPVADPAIAGPGPLTYEWHHARAKTSLAHVLPGLGGFAYPCGFANPAAVAVPQSGFGQAPSEKVASEGCTQLANSLWDAQSTVNSKRIRPEMPRVQ